MTALVCAAAAMCALAGLVLVLRARIAAARRETRAVVEALRAELGLPAGRCRVIDVTLRESVSAALDPSQRLSPFEHVHRVPRRSRRHP